MCTELGLISLWIGLRVTVRLYWCIFLHPGFGPKKPRASLSSGSLFAHCFLAFICSCFTFPVTSSGLSLMRLLFAVILSFDDDDDDYDHRAAYWSKGTTTTTTTTTLQASVLD